MRYFVTAADDARAEAVAAEIEAAGYTVAEEYDPDEELAVVTVGGDGAVLYAARRFGERPLIPVVKPDSEGNTIELDRETLPTAIEAFETGTAGVDFRIESHRRLAVEINGSRLRDGFAAINDVTLQHATPIHAAEFGLTVTDGDFEYSIDRAIGDGVVIATPFGATGYYRSIADGVFTTGVGVALNNVHKPADALTHLVCSPEAAVVVEPADAEHAADLVLTRDNDPETYTPEPTDRIVVDLSGPPVEVVRFPGLKRAN